MTNKAGLQREQGGEGLLAGRAQLTAAIRTLVREGPGWVVACVPDRAGGWRTHLRPGESEGMEGKLDFGPRPLRRGAGSDAKVLHVHDLLRVDVSPRTKLRKRTENGHTGCFDTLSVAVNPHSGEGRMTDQKRILLQPYNFCFNGNQV